VSVDDDAFHVVEVIPDGFTHLHGALVGFLTIPNPLLNTGWFVPLYDPIPLDYSTLRKRTENIVSDILYGYCLGQVPDATYCHE
jgi:hypothetical protein